MAPVISLSAEAITYWGTLPITNTLVVSLVISVSLMLFAIIFRPFIKSVPSGIQNIVEMIFEGAVDFIESVLQDRKAAYQYFPVVFTIFLFVILYNWIEIVPGLGSIGVWGEHHGEIVLIPFIRSSSADMNVTIAIAISAMISVQIYGSSALGIGEYAGKFLVSPFKKPYFIGTFVGLLEIVSEFAKIISFSFRLFGNIFAGEVLLLVVGFLIPYIVPLPFIFLEIFVGFIQALVFSMLTLVFIKNAATAHH
ncbi:F0F1 ATP synthase subunit A [Patescibacteria group bacterium]|nr:F0F1 ATP synthase subunit A [Patescibacteria group bacterium]